ncbi:alpha/beta hydrolase, partial [Candidatus Kaiserbacteria bacterium]|nr:alpha/beta hydrolase [Candidatus Kaiserbacteria bacterium]
LASPAAPPIGIIHGTADDVIPLSNSEAIIAACANGTLKTIEGAGHSFKDHEDEVELLALTHELLK